MSKLHPKATKAESAMLDEAYAIYEQDGPSAVLDWATEKHPELEWSLCEPCEYDTPTIAATCAVCWSAK